MKVDTNKCKNRPSVIARGACAGLAILALGSSTQATAEDIDSDGSITIYSRMQAGAVSPEWYRPAGMWKAL